jgi:hypothetical protein
VIVGWFTTRNCIPPDVTTPYTIPFTSSKLIRSSDGVFYATEFLRRVWVIYPNNTNRVFSGGNTNLTFPIDGAGTVVSFNAPKQLAFDVNGTLLISDSRNFRIRKVDARGSARTFVGTIKGTSDGMGTNASFTAPNGLAIEPTTGTMYISDNQCIRSVQPSGLVNRLAGKCGSSGTNDGVGSNARFFGPGVRGKWGLQMMDACRLVSVALFVFSLECLTLGFPSSCCFFSPPHNQSVILHFPWIWLWTRTVETSL